MVRPLITERDEERRKVAEICSKQDRINQKLRQIEYTLGLDANKPQVFEEIENKVAEIKADFAIYASETNHQVALCDQRVEKVERDMHSCETDMKLFKSLMNMRDKQTAEVNEKFLEMR